MVDWLSAPWRVVSGVVGPLLRAIVRHVPTARAALLIAAVAVVQLVQHHAWLSLATLVGLFVVAVVQPMCDAAVSRASERAADRYTVSHGSGYDLARVLRAFPSSRRRVGGGPAIPTRPDERPISPLRQGRDHEDVAW